MTFHSLPATFVSHVALHVSNIEASLVFYEQIIGFRVLQKTETMASLTIDDQEAVLTLYELENAPPLDRKASGMYHIAFLLPSRIDLGEMYLHARKYGLLHEGAADHLVNESIYLSDPDGNGVEFYADRDPSDWMWNDKHVAMDTVSLDTADLVSHVKKEWTGLPIGTVIGHIHLQVHDLEATARFYTDYFSFDLVNAYGGKAMFLSTEHYHHHIGLNTWNSVDRKALEEPHIGMQSFTLHMTEENREQTITKLEASAFSVDDPTGLITITDPAGNHVIF